MMRSAIIGALMALASTAPAYAQSQEEIDEGARAAYELARSYSQCAGFWDFMSAAELASGNSASAQNSHNIGNGARLSAGYTLSLRHRLQRPEEPPRTYGSWHEFIEPLAEVTVTRLMAAVERGNMADLERQAVICRAMAEQSDEIIDQLRAERAY